TKDKEQEICFVLFSVLCSLFWLRHAYPDRFPAQYVPARALGCRRDRARYLDRGRGFELRAGGLGPLLLHAQRRRGADQVGMLAFVGSADRGNAEQWRRGARARAGGVL